MKRFLTIAALCLFGSLPARAATYYVDLTDIVPVGSTFGPCYCGYGPVFPIYSANPGDIFDFGSVTLTQIFDSHSAYHLQWYDQATMQWVYPYLTFSPTAVVSYNPNSIPYGGGGTGYDSGLNGPPTLRSYTVELDFVVPENAYSIQIGWNGNGVYTPPEMAAAVPEPSTWAMMLLGFAALGGLLQLKNAKRAIPVASEVLA